MAILSSITVLNNIVVLITEAVYIAQASSCFKCLDMCTFTYATPTFITEVHYLVTQVKLPLMTVTVN